MLSSVLLSALAAVSVSSAQEPQDQPVPVPAPTPSIEQQAPLEARETNAGEQAVVAPTPAPVPEPPKQLPQAIAQAPTPEPQGIEPRKHQFVLGVFLGSSGTAKFENGSVRTTSASGPFELEIELGPVSGVLLEVRRMPEFSWGFQAGVEIEVPREITKLTLRGAGGSASVTYYLNPKLRHEIIYANAVYRWEQFYVPFGLNYAVPHLDDRGMSSASQTTLSPSVGAQVGIGWAFNDHFSLELVDHVTGLTGKETGTGSDWYIATYGYGTVSDVRLFAKLAF